MTAAEKKAKLVETIEAGHTVIINAMGARLKIKKTYKAWQHWGADIFWIGDDGFLYVRFSKDTSGIISAACIA